jgi:Uma2 family endonuclease
MSTPPFYTYADYFAWPEAVRGELIAGQFYDMSRARTPRHQRISANLLAQLTIFFRGRVCCPYGAPFDVRLPRPGEHEGAERDVVQPDVAVVCDPAKIDDRGCRGAPDWIIEVLSLRTREEDLTVKRELYEHHCVPLYWVVSPRERSLIVLPMDRASAHYPALKSSAASGRRTVPEFPGLVIDWDWVFERE